MTMANLRNIGLKSERMMFQRTYLLNFPARAEPCYSFYYPSSPKDIFGLTGHEWALTCWPKI